MPLSEREQALLEQMEQALYAEDPRFAAQLASATPSTFRHRRLVIGLVGVVAGLGVVLLGVTQQLVWLGVVGFLVMVAAGVFALTTPRRQELGAVQPDGSVRTSRRRAVRGMPAHQRRAGRSGSFMQRLEHRWDERRARGDF